MEIGVGEGVGAGVRVGGGVTIERWLDKLPKALKDSAFVHVQLCEKQREGDVGKMDVATLRGRATAPLSRRPHTVKTGTFTDIKRERERML